MLTLCDMIFDTVLHQTKENDELKCPSFMYLYKSPVKRPFVV